MDEISEWYDSFLLVPKVNGRVSLCYFGEKSNNVCTYMSAHIHTYIDNYIHSYMHTQTDSYMSANMYT